MILRIMFPTELSFPVMLTKMYAVKIAQPSPGEQMSTTRVDQNSSEKPK